MKKQYKDRLTASINRKGVLDIDTVKGCAVGIKKYGPRGCYNLCYASKTAGFYGYDFGVAVSRKISDAAESQTTLFDLPGDGGDSAIVNMVKNHHLDWFRIGTMGDPCHDWELTVEVCEWLGAIKTPVIVTKHWMICRDQLLNRLRNVGVVFNTSVSALDSKQELKHRLKQYERIKQAGIKSVLRIVSCEFGNTEEGRRLDEVQRELFSYPLVIDNPLRIPASDERVVRGDIVVSKLKDLDTITFISMNNKETYLGHCDNCPDQCGLTVKEG
jgi:hypothetical protein